jgi:hypothetical protein
MIYLLKKLEGSLMKIFLKKQDRITLNISALHKHRPAMKTFLNDRLLENKLTFKLMKINAFKLLGIISIPLAFACSSNSDNSAANDSTDSDSADSMQVAQASYVNLSTGEPVSIVKDEDKGYYVYSDTKQPVEKDVFFVDVNRRDTLYGSKGVVVNSAIIRSDSGNWSLNEEMIERNGDDITIKTTDGKLKIDGDEMKYKEGDDVKTKVDGDESKSKSGDAKTKVDGAEMKTKTPETKVKVED